MGDSAVALERVADALGVSRRREDGSFSARCPAHDDRVESLSVAPGRDGRVLLFCFAGCRTQAIIDALGFSWPDVMGDADPSRPPVHAVYEYKDADGRVLYRKIRTEDKVFWHEERGEQDSILYNLPELVRADDVFYVEGEKDVERLRQLGVVATTAGGASNWRSVFALSFRGKRVTIIPDQDGPGRRHADAVAAAIRPHAAEVRFKWAAAGKDVSDHIASGFTLDQLLDHEPGLLDEFGPWDPWQYEAPADEWLFKPYVPRKSRVLVHGTSGSLKTLWALWLAMRLAGRGERVAFFEREMSKEKLAKRCRQWDSKPETLQFFSHVILGSSLQTLIRAFEGYSLVIVDSWSATQGDMASNDNDSVSRLDNEFLQPFVEATGATILIIDNTGHYNVTRDGIVPRNTARGASRKRDIQEVEIHFSRPDTANNFRAALEITKMRLDVPVPPRVVIETPPGRPEFYIVKAGERTEELFKETDSDDIT